MGLQRRARRHTAGVDPEVFRDFRVGQRVLTIADNIPGVITDVQDGPYPGTEMYTVELDDGLGGGEYDSGDLSPLEGVEASSNGTAASLEVQADLPSTVADVGGRVASEDYPELSEILVERPPLERQAAKGDSVHTCTKCGQDYFTWRTYTNTQVCEDCSRLPFDEPVQHEAGSRWVTCASCGHGWRAKSREVTCPKCSTDLAINGDGSTEVVTKAAVFLDPRPADQDRPTNSDPDCGRCGRKVVGESVKSEDGVDLHIDCADDPSTNAEVEHPGLGIGGTTGAVITDANERLAEWCPRCNVVTLHDYPPDFREAQCLDCGYWHHRFNEYLGATAVVLDPNREAPLHLQTVGAPPEDEEQAKAWKTGYDKGVEQGKTLMPSEAATTTMDDMVRAGYEVGYRVGHEAATSRMQPPQLPQDWMYSRLRHFPTPMGTVGAKQDEIISKEAEASVYWKKLQVGDTLIDGKTIVKIEPAEWPRGYNLLHFDDGTREAMGGSSILRVINRNDNAASDGPAMCGRCGGAGGRREWPGYTCYECGGSGSITTEAGFFERKVFELADAVDKRLPEHLRYQEGHAPSTDWCRFRKDERCMFPRLLNINATRQAGYPVWVPEDRGHCPRHKWADQRTCPVAEPGPDSGDPDAQVDATTAWEDGGQRPRVGQMLPVVSVHGADSAAFESSDCTQCNGTGEQGDGKECYVCDGSGDGAEQRVGVGLGITNDNPENDDAIIASLRATAAADPSFAWHFTAGWADVRAKAKEIRSEGGVRIIRAPNEGDSLYIVAEVKGSTNLYQTTLMRSPGSKSIAMWECGCAWAKYSWGRSGRWKKYEGRMCAHALATMFEAQAQEWQGGRMREQATEPQWKNDPTIRVKQPGDQVDKGRPDGWRLDKPVLSALQTEGRAPNVWKPYPKSAEGLNARDIARTLMEPYDEVVNQVLYDLGVVSKAEGGAMEGEQFRLKGLDRLTEKIEQKVLARGLNPFDPKVYNEYLNDVMRFTMVFHPLMYSQSVQDALYRLQELGYTVGGGTNTWPRGDMYSGLHMQIFLPHASDAPLLGFELQFHTQDSFKLKQNALHKLYEEFRDKATPVARKQQLFEMMTPMWDTVEIPRDILQWVTEQVELRRYKPPIDMSVLRERLKHSKKLISTDPSLALAPAEAIAKEAGVTEFVVKVRNALHKVVDIIGGKLRLDDGDEVTPNEVTHPNWDPRKGLNFPDDRRYHAAKQTDDVWAFEAAQADTDGGVMVCLRPPERVCTALHPLGNEDFDNLHVTLAYLGNVNEDPEIDLNTVKAVVAKMASGANSFLASISGFGVFLENDANVLYASIDCPGLDEFRAALVNALKAAGQPVREDHGFTPHMTLAYDYTKAMPDLPNEAQGRWTFNSVIAAKGKEWTKFPLRGLGFVFQDAGLLGLDAGWSMVAAKTRKVRPSEVKVGTVIAWEYGEEVKTGTVTEVVQTGYATRSRRGGKAPAPVPYIFVTDDGTKHYVQPGDWQMVATGSKTASLCEQCGTDAPDHQVRWMPDPEGDSFFSGKRMCAPCRRERRNDMVHNLLTTMAPATAMAGHDPNGDVEWHDRQGNCFEFSLQYFQQNYMFPESPRARLVHGTIFSLLFDKPIAHGWVLDDDGEVFEPTSGKHYPNRAAFDAIFKADWEVQYNGTEAAKKMVTSGHYGPWHRSKGLLGPMAASVQKQAMSIREMYDQAVPYMGDNVDGRTTPCSTGDHKHCYAQAMNGCTCPHHLAAMLPQDFGMSPATVTASKAAIEWEYDDPNDYRVGTPSWSPKRYGENAAVYYEIDLSGEEFVASVMVNEPLLTRNVREYPDMYHLAIAQTHVGTMAEAVAWCENWDRTEGRDYRERAWQPSDESAADRLLRSRNLLVSSKDKCEHGMVKGSDGECHVAMPDGGLYPYDKIQYDPSRWVHGPFVGAVTEIECDRCKKKKPVAQMQFVPNRNNTMRPDEWMCDDCRGKRNKTIMDVTRTMQGSKEAGAQEGIEQNLVRPRGSNEVPDTGDTVTVYRHLGSAPGESGYPAKTFWSIKNDKGGNVIAYTQGLRIRNVRPVFLEGERRRRQQSEDRSPHAFLQGTVDDYVPTGSGREVSYFPDISEFFLKDTRKILISASAVTFLEGKCLAEGVVEGDVVAPSPKYEPALHAEWQRKHGIAAFLPLDADTMVRIQAIRETLGMLGHSVGHGMEPGDGCEVPWCMMQCDVVAEALNKEFGLKMEGGEYHGPDIKGMDLVPGAKPMHWWNRHTDGTIIDATADQFDNSPHAIRVIPKGDPRQRYYVVNRRVGSKTSGEHQGTSVEELARLDAGLGIGPDPSKRSDRAYMEAYNAAVLDARREQIVDLAPRLVNEQKGVEAELHDPAEPALPATTADEEVDEPDESSRSWLMGEAKQAGGDMNVAAAAKQFLETGTKPGEPLSVESMARTAVRKFSPAEQAKLINEGEGVTAANLGDLDIAGTHYESLEAALRQIDDPDLLF